MVWGLFYSLFHLWFLSGYQFHIRQFEMTHAHSSFVPGGKTHGNVNKFILELFLIVEKLSYSNIYIKYLYQMWLVSLQFFSSYYLPEKVAVIGPFHIKLESQLAFPLANSHLCSNQYWIMKKISASVYGYTGWNKITLSLFWLGGWTSVADGILFCDLSWIIQK